MPAPGTTPTAAADQIRHAIVAKLDANRPLLAKSHKQGRVSWRLQTNGQIQVDFEIKT